MRARLTLLAAIAAGLLVCSTALARTIVGDQGANRMAPGAGEDTVNVSRFKGNRRRVKVAGDC